MAVNMLSVLLPRLLTGLVLFFVVTRYQSSAQSPDCPTGDALLSASDPVYADANELAQSLRNSGFVVRCVFPTHLGSIFRVVEAGVERSTIEGEANFHTNYSDVDVVFLPKPQTFSDFTITEHREDEGFFYTFAGTPRVWAVNRFEGGRRWYFLKRDNQLLLVSNDKLRSRLERVLHLRTP